MIQGIQYAFQFQLKLLEIQKDPGLRFQVVAFHLNPDLKVMTVQFFALTLVMSQLM
jgi:hypothetical protein